jgi:hypothetical protein
VAGARGVLISDSTEDASRHHLLVFAKDGIVYGLEGAATAQELLAAAESMF